MSNPQPATGQELVLSSQAFMDLIERAAKDPAVDVTKMTALFELAKSVNAERARALFNAGLSTMQAEIPIVDEDGIADFGGTDKRPYATFENIMGIVRPILARHEFSITFSTRNDKPTEVTVTGTLLHAAGHGRDASLTFPADASGKKNPVQALASAISYAERHLTKALLSIATRKADDDAEGTEGAESLGAAQVLTIEALLKSSGADRQKFLAWIGAESVETIKAARFERAVAALRQKEKPTADDLKTAARQSPVATEAAPPATCAHAGIAEAVRVGAQKVDEPPPACSCGHVCTESEMRAMLPPAKPAQAQEQLDLRAEAPAKGGKR